MKKNLLLTFISASILCFALTLITSESSTHPTNPDWGYTGAPLNSSFENTCGKSTCHNYSTANFTGTLSVSADSQYYNPGNTYTITVSIDETGINKFGFEICCLDASNVKAGTASLINTAITSNNTTVNNRWYVGHHSANSTKVWQFNWTAPSTNVGDVTFYATGVCANGDGHDTGDHVGKTTFVFSPNPFNGVADVEANGSSLLIQNPVSDKILVSFKNAVAGKSTVQLFDSNGKLVSVLMNENQNTGIETRSFDKPAASGIYFLDYTHGNFHEVKKVVVL
ncbi:MAG TPA: hypothetical protein DCQ93_03835 [Bacteroidetes bacterium]|nr:hypothetical protein [Bacteroidota bacterium]